MLSAQRKEFDDKKKDESPYPRDFARWYALDYFLRPRVLRAGRFYVTLATFLIFTCFSAISALPALHRVHQSAHTSKAHAMFNDNCASCHDQPFQPVLRLFGQHGATSVSDQRCNECHHGAAHHKNAPERACASCHREHRGHDTLASHVADRACTECHRDLHAASTDGKTSYHAAITHFNRDHPEFQPSLKDRKDPSKIKFSHKAHLDLDVDALRRGNPLKGLGAKLACVDCHQMDEERKYLKPIQYDKHCAQCHALNVPLVGDFAKELLPAVAEFQRIPAPHKEPAVIRAVLRDRLADFAQQHSIAAGKGVPRMPRPLPWKPVAEDQWSWASEETKKAEAVLFMNKQWHKSEPLLGCSHCHVEKGAADGLPVYEKSAIPDRWYKHSIFNHGSHRMMGCVECHDRNAAGLKVEHSQSAADILMPTLQSCQQCHGATGGARNSCVECHRYHDRAQERTFDGHMKMEDILGRKHP
jgi:hypothetical protein